METGNEVRATGCTKVVAIFLAIVVAILLLSCNQKLYSGTHKRTPNPNAR